MDEEHHQSFAESENSTRYAVLRKYLEEALQSNQQIDQCEEIVTWQQYMIVVNDLELERESHKKTKQELVEVQDKLAFALGEVEILRKQIEREKAQFEITFGSLSKLSADEGHSFKNCDIDERWTPGCDVISDVRQGQLSFRDQLSELNVQMQQDSYISKLIEQSSSRPTSSGVKHRRQANSDLGKYPSTISASSCKERRERERTVADNESWKYPASARTNSRPTSTTSFRK